MSKVYEFRTVLDLVTDPDNYDNPKLLKSIETIAEEDTANGTNRLQEVQNAAGNSFLLLMKEITSRAIGIKRRAYNDQIVEKLRDIAPEREYETNDIGNGDLFAAVFSDQLHWNTDKGQWDRYNGKFWEADEGGIHAEECAKDFQTALMVYSCSILDEDKQKRFQKNAVRIGSRRVRETMLEDARSKLAITGAEYDTDDYLLNLKNGVLDLKTFQLIDHHPEQNITKICNAEYVEGARSERWEQFIDEIMCGDAEKADFLQRIIGYSLTGSTKEEVFFMLYGSTTRNGKGTLIETISYLLNGANGYACGIEPESLAKRNINDGSRPSPDIARLKDCRFLNCAEPDRGMLLDVALIKRMTGRDTISARELYAKKIISFIPKFKLFMNTNYLPVVTDDTLFSSDRVYVVPFDRHFSDEERDKSLKDRFRDPVEAAGILNWCLEGLRKYQERGLERPSAIESATEEYRKQSDKLGTFFQECMEQAKGCESVKAIYERYVEWCHENGYGTENKRNFMDLLKRKGLHANSGTVNGITVRNVVPGFQIITEFVPAGATPFDKYRAM